MQNIVLNLERKSKRDIAVAANDFQESQTRTQAELERTDEFRWESVNSKFNTE